MNVPYLKCTIFVYISDFRVLFGICTDSRFDIELFQYFLIIVSCIRLWLFWIETNLYRFLVLCL